MTADSAKHDSLPAKIFWIFCLLTDFFSLITIILRTSSVRVIDDHSGYFA